MGLDQYLHATKYLPNTDIFGAERAEQYDSVISALKAESFIDDQLPSAEVSVKVAYWRKANHIHKWFVDNCQNGEDDCRKAYVSREKLEELLKLCKTVLENVKKGDTSVAEEYLPTESGCFFGSLEYDDGYKHDLEYTVNRIEKIIATVPEDWDFEYQSSW